MFANTMRGSLPVLDLLNKVIVFLPKGYLYCIRYESAMGYTSIYKTLCLSLSYSGTLVLSCGICNCQAGALHLPV